MYCKYVYIYAYSHNAGMLLAYGRNSIGIERPKEEAARPYLPGPGTLN